MNESILDKPQDTLDPSVWNVADDNITLTEEATAKIQKAVDYVQGKWNFPDLSVFIIGSITSNSYSRDSDIDVHICSPMEGTKEDISNFGWNLKQDFIENYLNENIKDSEIGGHPIEIYFNPNPFHCMMSVGCYNFTEQKWEVGPAIKSTEYDPIADYYPKSQKIANEYLSQIRQQILSIYELALVMSKSDTISFKNRYKKELISKLEKTSKLFSNIRKMREAYEQYPMSKEEALVRRNDKKWLVADATYKFLTKFGYIDILKAYDKVLENASDENNDELIYGIIEAVRSNFSSNRSLNDSEKQYFIEADQSLSEGPRQAFSISLLAALLAIPGILPAEAAQNSIDKNQQYQMIVKDLNQNARMIGNYTALQAANIIARTLYAEARNDGKTGMTAVASVIYNRADGKASDFANVCKKHGYSKKAKRVVHQFSCWNRMTDEEWSQKNFKIKIPKTVKNSAKARMLWETAKKIAADMLSGSFTPTTDANMYYAPKKCSPDWAKKLTNTVMIGSHKFGKLKNHSAFK